ncbi:MAG: outer membrane beta-barrel protein [Myxococcota bacterium]
MAAVVLTLIATPAHGFEHTWHIGADGGWAVASFPEGGVSGFGGGAHGTYGLDDRFSVRMQGDVFAFGRPADRTSTLAVHGAAGAEYTLDVARWVIHGAAMLGPQYTLVPDWADGTPRDAFLQVAATVPVGLRYFITDHWTVGGEVQYRLLFLGPEDRPSQALFLLARVDGVFGWAPGSGVVPPDPPPVGPR